MSFYPDTPLRRLGDGVRFFAWLNLQMLELLAQWPGPVCILQSLPMELDGVDAFLWSLEGATTSS